MATRRRRQFLSGQIAWMMATIIMLATLEALSLELFFVVSLIGFLIVTELTAPLNVAPRWRKRLRVIIALGLLVFAYIVARRITEILSGVL
jgi:membrane protein implicated in regulation of membrane protease activity